MTDISATYRTQNINVDRADTSVTAHHTGPPGAAPAGDAGPAGALSGYTTQSEFDPAVSAIDARLDAYDALRTPWVVATLANSWFTYNIEHQPLRYRKINNIVFLEGDISSLFYPVDGIITTLPAGFRPPLGVLFPVARGDFYTSTIGRIDILPTGVVSITSGSSKLVSISGVQFGTA